MSSAATAIDTAGCADRLRRRLTLDSGISAQNRGGVVVALDLLEFGLETALQFGLGIIRSEQLDDLVVPEDFPEPVAAEDEPPALGEIPALYLRLGGHGAADLSEQLALIGMLRDLVVSDGTAHCVQLGDGMIQRAVDERLF